MSLRSRRTTPRPGRHRAHPTFESIEPRLLLTVYTVTNTLDEGPGSLRDAINSVNDDFLPDTIDFSIGRGPQRILLQSALPAILTQVTIDGTTQPGYSPTKQIPQIVIDGSQTGDPSQEGLTIDANDSIVQGLAIINSGDAGISISASGVGIYSNEIGIDPIQSVVAPNAGSGIFLQFASNNIIGAPGAGNLIAGNSSNGITLTVFSTGNLIQGNGIGTTLPGTGSGSGVSLSPQNIGNGGDGIAIQGVDGTTIGGTAAGTGNVISGNLGRGINAGGNGTLIQGNTIGLDAVGHTLTPNQGDGILIASSTGATIGGTATGAGNLISGNQGNGINVGGGSAILIQGNTIGLDVSGELSRGNSDDGVLIDASPGNTIGGSVAGAGNLIAANGGNGIVVNGSASIANLIQGNTIGIDLAGLKPLGNGTGGVELTNAPNNTVGGTTNAARNVIASNLGDGIDLNGTGASANLIEGNLVGTTPAYSTNSRFGNASNGINIQGAAGNTIGGTASGAGNILVLNQLNGVAITGGTATGNLIAGNHIGTDLAGDDFLGNFHAGIDIESAPRNTVGGTTTAARNFLVSNGTSGIVIQSSQTSNGVPVAADDNLVEGNDIGISLGTSGNVVSLGNSSDGVFIASSGNTIGGTAAGAGNVISANNSNGIDLGSAFGPSGSIVATGNIIENNLIGLDPTGTQDAGNGRDGIQVLGAFQTRISGNVISGNTNGIDLLGNVNGLTEPLGDTIVGNIIGLGSDGLTLNPTGGGASLKNTGNGILVENGAEGVTIGGTTPGSANVISGNGSAGVLFQTSAANDLVEGNLIGVGKDGLTARPNSQSGVLIGDGSTGITIGGMVAGAGNVISGNTIGITITGADTANSLVQGNIIGLGADGSTTVGNLSFGLLLLNGVTDNTIGGTTSGARNLISGNGQGIGINGPGSTGNVIEGNYVGLDSTGTLPRGNLQFGIYLSNASNNTIGGTVAGSGNVVSGDTGIGVVLFGPGSSSNLVAGNLIGLNAAGTASTAPNGASLGNSSFGLVIENAPLNTIGGSTAGAGNVISGNQRAGIELTGATAALNVIEGNIIGLDASGSVPLGNLADGIQLVNAPANLIGGVSASTRNVISGNLGAGVEFDGLGSLYNQVLGNEIGTNLSGLVGLGNGQSGVFVNGTPGVTIGGTIAGLGNLISGNRANGVQITGTASAGTVVLGNKIGVDARGVFPIANGNDGVLFDGTTGVTVGGTIPGSGNLISGNLANGVEFGGNGSSLDVLQGNLIGTDASGSAALPNATGVFLNSSTGNLIGGTAAFSGNLISGNTGPGVHVFGIGSVSNAIEGNRIGTNLLGSAPLANQAGVFLDASPGNLVSGNVLSGNTAAGVVIQNSTATANLIQGNLIGLDATGSRAIGSITPQQSGVLVNDAPGNVIGGTTGATRNVISGNTVGVVIAGFNARGNLVLGDLIGVDAAGQHAVANGTGVYINGSASNTIGGTIAGSTNVISGNTGVGVYLYGTLATNNVVAGNFIGTDATGTVAVRNSSGVYIELSSNNTIGGGSAAAGNLISGNSVAGVYLFNQASGNLIQHNRIGVSSTGKKLGNLQYGILFYNASNNPVPNTAAAANVIANSGIGNYREFTGSIASTTTTTKSKTKTVTTKTAHPTGPKVKAASVKVNRRGLA